MIHLFDTSALKWAYVPSKHHKRCRQILSRLRGQVYIAEITILEIVNALGSLLRDKKIGISQFEKANHSFLVDLASDRIVVHPFLSSEYLQCRHMLAYVGIRKLRKLETQDCIIAHTARQLAIERKSKVKLLTSDKRLARIVNEVDLFRRLVEVEYLSPR